MSLDDRREWLASNERGSILRTRVCAAEIWCEVLGNGVDRMKRFDAVEINQIWTV
ncbi:hypothetical protein RAH42_13085 (plasmid) [Pyramidobacter sp. YE332]|uniref:hypothetical protein n=1 Tax=Pyramidobacter sp. YE332 TaxID=3068894 RepID=UPI00294B2B9B|nr:hypothetical protein [Pyramidobacter sp. YE332]WOL41346.1 hypothetical protein RAH42_13085 [Pyramidobacter sp. YE332]